MNLSMSKPNTTMLSALANDDVLKAIAASVIQKVTQKSIDDSNVRQIKILEELCDEYKSAYATEHEKYEEQKSHSEQQAADLLKSTVENHKLTMSNDEMSKIVDKLWLTVQTLEQKVEEQTKYSEQRAADMLKSTIENRKLAVANVKMKQELVETIQTLERNANSKVERDNSWQQRIDALIIDQSRAKEQIHKLAQQVMKNEEEKRESTNVFESKIADYQQQIHAAQSRIHKLESKIKITNNLLCEHNNESSTKIYQLETENRELTEKSDAFEDKNIALVAENRNLLAHKSAHQEATRLVNVLEKQIVQLTPRLNQTHLQMAVRNEDTEMIERILDSDAILDVNSVIVEVLGWPSQTVAFKFVDKLMQHHSVDANLIMQFIRHEDIPSIPVIELLVNHRSFVATSADYDYIVSNGLVSLFDQVIGQ